MNDKLQNLIKDGFKKFNLGQIEKSKSLFKEVLNLQDDNFDALQALGVIYGQQNNHSLSSNYFLKAIKLKPEDFTVNKNLANSLLEIGKFEESISYLNNSLKINPKQSSLWCSKGIALKELKKYQDAEKHLIEAITLDNSNEVSYFHLGALYRTIKKYDDGIKIFHMALKVFQSPVILETIYTNLSNLYLDKKNSKFGDDYSLVAKYSKKALSINPNNYIALTNFAMSNLFEFNFDVATEILEKVIISNPNFAPAQRNLGALYNHLGNHSLAEKYIKSALILEPNDNTKKFILAEVLLSQNKFSEAWEFYEYRWVDTGDQIPQIRPNFTKPLWDPSVGYNHNLAIYAEQGLGDMILFSSILPELVSKFDKIFLLIDNRLCQIMNESIPGIEVIDFSKPITEDFFDYQLPLCSLGRYFRKEIINFKVEKPLLKIKNKLKLQKKKKYRCGVSWKSKGGLKSEKKNIGINFLHDIFKLDNIEFFDIQYTEDDEDNIKFKEQNNINFEKPKNLDTYNDIYGLLQFIDSCDFIISTSNTNAHLAAALGKPTLLLLPKEYGRLWYWDSDDDGKNLWYPSIYKFNQIIQGDWSHPISQLVEFIKNKYI